MIKGGRWLGALTWGLASLVEGRAVAQPAPPPMSPAPFAAPAPVAQPAPVAAPEPPPPPPPPFAPVAAPPADPPLAGYHEGFYLRDPSDTFRFYPRAQLFFDANGFFGPGVSALTAAEGGTGLKSRLYARRIRPEIGGEITRRVSFMLGVDLGGQAISNTNGTVEQSAAPPGKTPTAETARFAAVEAPAAAAALANCWVDFTVARELHVVVGQYQAPFSMENRTNDVATSWMERNLAIRGFAMPTGKEIGAMLWGDLGETLVGYEVGVFAGDGQNRPQVDNDADVMGRVFARPLSRSEGVLSGLQLGASGHFGNRDQSAVGYDVPAITTSQGFALWSPTYKDSKGRLTHIIPSGAQRAVGGELRVPFERFEVRGEAYFVARDTREAIDGFSATNTERLGRLTGVGWYAQVSAWPWGDAFVPGPPGFFRPPQIDLKKAPQKRKMGLEVMAIVAGVNASYDGAAREGAVDPKTPGGPAVGGAIRIYDVGLGANFWYTRHLRLAINYHAYVTPGSGSSDVLAVVPGNLGKSPDKEAHTLHELGGRVALQF